MAVVSPSILSADFADLSGEIKAVSNAPWLHFDVMDGHFVPNISFGIPVLRSVRRITEQFLDVHLMISDPLFYIEAFAEAGADLICFHAEACPEIEQAVSLIHRCGKKAAVALKPATPAEVIWPFLEILDMVLVMTVEPGFGGQVFQQEMLPKICEIRLEAEKRKPSLQIEVDGGINAHTAELCLQSGADVLVAGSYVFGADDPQSAVKRLQSA